LNPRNSTPRPLLFTSYALSFTPYALRSHETYLLSLKHFVGHFVYVKAKRSFKKVHRMPKVKKKYQGHCVKDPPVQGK
jgi:hypothetical protein